MADFKLRAPPRLRFIGAFSVNGVVGVGGVTQLAGSATARAVGQAALLKGVNLAGSASASSQAVAALLKGIRLSGSAVAAASGSSALGVSGAGAWNVGTVDVIVGLSGSAGGQFNISATGPNSYQAGGIFDVDASGTSLPSGMTLSPAGLLDVGSSSEGTTNGVVFGYAEPNAYPTITLHPSLSGTNTLPYFGTWYPNEGIVPSGYGVTSPDDANLRGSVLSTWPDGSAQVIVFAGEISVTSGVTKGVRLRVGQPGGAALSTSRINALVSTVAVNFGAGTQTLTLSGATADRVWWANSRTICARYRLSCGVGAMEAVIDIHAFAGGVSDRAFIEVVIENGRTNCAAATVAAPSTENYTNATVAVNGVTVATVSSPTTGMSAPNSRTDRGVTTYSGGHEAFRAWYCSAWVNGGAVSIPGGAADPQVEITHDADSLMSHPWFWRRAVVSSENLQTKYAQARDSYVPWATCRLRFPGMDGGAADEQIAMHTMAMADYFQSGDKNARRSVLATGQAFLSCAINWRHTDGSVPTRAQLAGKFQGSTWPEVTTPPRYGGAVTSDGSHIPSTTLVPFLCRPSPCFIEIAQKELAWNQVDYSPSGSGAHGYDQTRSRAWRMRNYAIATYLTPDSGTWATGAAADSTRKDGYRAMMRAEIDRDAGFLNQSWNGFKYLWDHDAGDLVDASSSRPKHQGHWFMHHFVTTAWSHVAAVKVLRGSDQTAMDNNANDICVYPLRWFSDAIAYEWRVVPYQPTVGVKVGSAGNYSIDQSPGDLQALTRVEMSGTVPSAPGPWIDFDTPATQFDYDYLAANKQDNSGGDTYPNWYFNAICAMVERGVSGSESAWSKIVSGINNLNTWINGGSSVPHWNRWPRNK